MLPLVYSIFIVVLSGCASSGNPDIKNQDLLSQVQMEKSTKEDVRRLLGEPEGITKSAVPVARAGNPSEMVTIVEWWSYIHYDVQSSPAAAIPFIGFFFAGSTAETASFQVGFDAKGVVQQVSQSQSRSSSGMFK